MRKISVLFGLVGLIATTSALAAIPGSASLPSGSDRVQGSSGITCESSNAPDAYVDVGVYGENSDRDYGQVQSNYYNSSYDGGDKGAYVRLVVPIGGPKKRLDCTKLYDLELQRLQAEIQMLKRQTTQPAVQWDK